MLASAGLPPLGGFVSEWLLLQSFLFTPGLPVPLLTMLISAVILAIIVPARGDFAEWFSAGTKFAVALLFYLYGARLSTAEAIRGLTHWRLHLMILSCTFVLFPLFGLPLQLD